MTKSFSQIMSQIQQLTREATALQSGVIARIRKEIAQHGLTPEHLFGRGVGKGAGTLKAKSLKASKSKGAPKFADGNGNSWGGMGKRPGWIHEALAAGKSLDDFLVANNDKVMAVPKKVRVKASTPKKTASVAAKVVKATAAKKSKPSKKAATPRKQAKPSAAPSL